MKLIEATIKLTEPLAIPAAIFDWYGINSGYTIIGGKLAESGDQWVIFTDDGRGNIVADVWVIPKIGGMYTEWMMM